MSDEDYAIATKLVKEGEYDSWEKLVRAIAEYKELAKPALDFKKESESFLS